MSKIQDTRIPPHQHCKVCGKAVAFGKDYCSNECKEKSEKTQRRTKTLGRAYMVILLAIFAALMLYSLLAAGR